MLLLSWQHVMWCSSHWQGLSAFLLTPTNPSVEPGLRESDG